jgi:CheY-like chemotaxis protein
MSSPLAHRSGGRVLVVDDDPMVLRAYDRVLKNAGFSVETASDGRMGLDLIKHGEYDVVLSDISLPGMTGIQVLKEAHEKDRDLPVLLITGDPRMETAIQAVEYGALHYLLKPIEASLLQRSVTDAARQRRLSDMRRKAFAQMGKVVQAAVGREGAVMIPRAPIVGTTSGELFGYKVLPEMVGRELRERMAADVEGDRRPLKWFVRVGEKELADPELFMKHAPLSKVASKVVLALADGSAPEAQAKIAALKDLGFELAVEDVGAGYSSLNNLVEVRPSFATIHRDLVSQIDTEPAKQAVFRSLHEVCAELGVELIADRVERTEERRALAELGCVLMVERSGPCRPIAS